MKTKIVALALCAACAAAASAQENGNERLANIDWAEDSTEIMTVNDIINVQQEVASRNTSVRHFEEVWSRRGYINVAYSSQKLSPKGTIETGVSLNNGRVADFKSDWGVALQIGRSYRLHKKPIGNVAQFYIDYTYVDFDVNHFKAEGDGTALYDSSKQFTVTGSKGSSNSYYYTPWNLEKYQASYGMLIGPSLTVAPFNAAKQKALHYLKFNAYWHIGYHAAVLYMPNNEDADANPDTTSDSYEQMSDNMKLNWGHGLTHSFGFNVSWKAIGLGFEQKTGKLQYKPTGTSDFGKEKYDFTTATSRIYVQFRM